MDINSIIVVCIIWGYLSIGGGIGLLEIRKLGKDGKILDEKILNAIPYWLTTFCIFWPLILLLKKRWL